MEESQRVDTQSRASYRGAALLSGRVAEEFFVAFSWSLYVSTGSQLLSLAVLFFVVNHDWLQQQLHSKIV